MQIRDYLDRIGAAGPLDPSIETLVGLHELHMTSVPFENLDIPLGRDIVIDERRFLGKLVEERRGGFCYELNGAFAWLLRGIGFDVTYLSARVFNAEGVPGPDFDHMALLVRLDGGSWIADVGFGDSFRAPLRLVADEQQTDSDPRKITYRFTIAGDTWTLWKLSRDSAEWMRQYAFTLEPRTLEQYEPMCRYQQTSPQSTFTRKVVCSKATSEGRITLTATAFIETTPEGRVETPVARSRWYRLLKDYFGVELPGEIVRWP